MCFQKDGKISQSSRCIKSIIMDKVIDYVLLIDKFEQQCVVIKGTLQSPRLKYHIQTIGIDQSLKKKLYMNINVLKTSKNYTNKLVSVTTRKTFKDILEAAIVYTPEGFTDDSPISPMKSTPVKKPRVRKSLCPFTKILYVKKKCFPSSKSF